MNDDETNRLYRNIADSLIDVANRHCDNADIGIVGSAFLYGAARFSAFVVASGSQELGRYEAGRDEAISYFSKEFRRMLEENLDDYKSVFKEQPRYSHLVRNKNTDTDY